MRTHRGKSILRLLVIATIIYALNCCSIYARWWYTLSLCFLLSFMIGLLSCCTTISSCSIVAVAFLASFVAIVFIAFLLFLSMLFAACWMCHFHILYLLLCSYPCMYPAWGLNKFERSLRLCYCVLGVCSNSIMSEVSFCLRNHPFDIVNVFIKQEIIEINCSFWDHQSAICGPLLRFRRFSSCWRKPALRFHHPLCWSTLTISVDSGN